MTRWIWASIGIAALVATAPLSAMPISVAAGDAVAAAPAKHFKPVASSKPKLSQHPVQEVSQQVSCYRWGCHPVPEGCRLERAYREHVGDPSNGVEVCRDGTNQHRLDTPS